MSGRPAREADRSDSVRLLQPPASIAVSDARLTSATADDKVRGGIAEILAYLGNLGRIFDA
jgi:hypothetical protein